MANETNVIQSLGSYYNSLIKSDYVKAGITAFFSAAQMALLTGLYDLLSKDNIPTWKQITLVLVSALTAGIGALIRKYKTNAVGQPFKKDPPAINTVDTITTGK